MHPLLLQLDLDHPGLEEANARARASRIHEALAAVVRYFRARPEPDPSLLATPNAGAVEASERAIAREFVFYQVPGKVPPGNWDWTWRPGTDWEWTYALNRHHWWAELAAAYLATGDQRYAQELDSLIRSWVGQCPVHVDDISSWRTLETGIRVAGPWIGILSAMKATPVITDTAWIMYLRAIHDHAEHLVAHPKANNWLLVESNGLLTCGIVFPEFRRAKDWVRTAVERFEREMEQSVHPDGAHIEYSSSYHFLSLHSFTAAMDKADRTVGRVFSDAFRNRLELMWEYPMYMMRPDGRLPLLNDSDTADIRPQLRAAGERFGRQDFVFAATNGREGTPPADTSHRFPWVRRAVMRSGWDEHAFYGFLETAPCGSGHVNEDALTFEIMAYGQPLIGTMGRYSYDPVPVRRYLVSSAAYNTVMIDGEGQKWTKTHPDRSTWVAREPTADPWSSTAEQDVAYGRFNGPWTGDLSGVVWERRMAFHKPDAKLRRPGFWVVRDTFTGEGGHELRFLLHFYPGNVVCDDETHTVRSDYSGAHANVLVAFEHPEAVKFDCAHGQEDPPRGWYSARYGVIEPAWEVAVVRAAVFPADFVMVFVPYQAEAKLPVRVKRDQGVVSVQLDDREWLVSV